MSLERQIVDTATGEIKSRGTLGENSNFVMFFRPEMHSIRAIAIEDGKALSVFMLITEHMDEQNSLIVSRETMSELLGISVPTIDRKLKYLKEKNFLTVVKSGTANIYCVNANIAWSTFGNKKDYAKFKTNVLVSRTEQEYKIKKGKTRQLDLLEDK